MKKTEDGFNFQHDICSPRFVSTTINHNHKNGKKKKEKDEEL